MSSGLTRVFWSLLINAMFLGVTIGLIYLISGNETALVEATRTQYADDPGTLADILNEARWQLIMWAILSLAVTWILSSLWLLTAERQRPTTPAEGASSRGLWVVLLLLCLSALSAIGWYRIWRAGIQLDLATSTLTLGMVTIGFTVLIAYFVSTTLSVKTVMRPSVPFSNLLPHFSKGKP